MRDYSGVLLDTLASRDDFTEEAEPLPCETNGHGWGHSGAIHHTISQICLGARVRLVRRKMVPNALETPGEVVGQAIGSSHQSGGRIILGVELDDGEVVGVDVSNPGEWSWEVS